MGKRTIPMAIFNSEPLVIPRLGIINFHIPGQFIPVNHPGMEKRMKPHESLIPDYQVGYPLDLSRASDLQAARLGWSVVVVGPAGG